MADDKQRLDKWLCFARVVKSRTRAARLVADGHVRLNGRRIQDPAYPASRGDVLTIALDREVRVLRIVGIGDRRGPFKNACLLLEDLREPTGLHALDSATNSEHLSRSMSDRTRLPCRDEAISKPKRRETPAADR